MSIEPIGSMMTLQAQPMNVKPVEPAQKTAEYNSQNASNPEATVDINTRTVENTQEKGNSNSDNNASENTYRQAEQATSEQIKEAIEKFNKASGANSEAVFGIHEGTNRVTIKIVDKDTKETIKELPPEKTLDMIARVWEMAGIMVDEKR